MGVRTALVFPGQGSQRPGMLERLPELEAMARLLDAAEALSGFDLRTIAMEGSVEDLADTRIAQPLLFLADWTWGVTLLGSGVEPFALAGHSLGELAALAVAGAFSPEAGLELVVERSRLMASAAASSPGTMAAVLGLDRAAVGEAIESADDVWVANDNAPGQVVISGTNEGVAQGSAILLQAGARKIVPLAVSGPFHTPLMESARASFAEILDQTEFADASIPILQNTDPTPGVRGHVLRERLRGQITSPVRWTETMRALRHAGPATVVESGPGSVLAGLGRRIEGITAVAVESEGLERVVEEVM